jgi:hypothetical protein
VCKMRKAYRDFQRGKKNRVFERHKCRWKRNIKMGLVETGLQVVDCIYLALNRDRLLLHMNSEMKFHEMRQLLD